MGIPKNLWKPRGARESPKGSATLQSKGIGNSRRERISSDPRKSVLEKRLTNSIECLGTQLQHAGHNCALAVA